MKRVVRPLGIVERVGTVFVGLAVAAWCLRGFVSDGIVGRGDDVLRAGEASSALRYYRRAYRVAPTSLAAGRVAFVGWSQHRSVLCSEALADYAHAWKPANAHERREALWDEALCKIATRESPRQALLALVAMGDDAAATVLRRFTP